MRGSPRRCWSALTLGVCLQLGSPTPGHGQITLTQGLSLSGSARLRYESWNWFDPGTLPVGGEHRYGFFAAQSHLALKADPARWLDARLDVQNTTFLNLPENANGPAPTGDLGLGASYYAPHRESNDSRVFVHQAAVTLKQATHPATYLRAGRFEYLDGVEVMTGDPTLDWLKRNRLTARLIGTFGFSNVGRSFDGATAALDRGRFNLTALAVRPRQGGFELDGMKELTEVDLAALTLTTKPGLLGKRTEGRLFYIYYGDRRDPRDTVVKTDNRPLPVRQADSASIGMSQFGGHLVRAIPSGRGTIDLTGWGVYQTGHWGQLDHRAWAAALEAGYQFPLGRLNPWVRVGYLRASGDDDPTDQRHGTFFQTVTTVRLYAQFPFYNMMNSSDCFGQLVLRPVPGKLALRSDLHLLRLTESADLWYVGSGVTQRTRAFGYGGRPSGGSSDLGKLLDASVTWDPHPKVGVYGYLGHAFGGDVVQNIYQGSGGTFAYLETTLRF